MCHFCRLDKVTDDNMVVRYLRVGEGDGVNELPRMVGKQKTEITNKLPLSNSPFFFLFFFVPIVSGRLFILGVSRKLLFELAKQNMASCAVVFYLYVLDGKTLSDLERVRNGKE